MRSSLCFLLLALFSLHQLQADTLTVFNHARYTICVSLYSVATGIWSRSVGPANRQTPVVKIAAHSQGQLERQGYSLPAINFDTVLQQPVNVFSSQDNPQAPTSIYIVPVKQDGYDPAFDPAQEFPTTYKTANFSYNHPAIEKLAGLIRYSLITYQDSVLNAVKEVMARK